MVLPLNNTAGSILCGDYLLHVQRGQPVFRVAQSVFRVAQCSLHSAVQSACVCNIEEVVF